MEKNVPLKKNIGVTKRNVGTLKTSMEGSVAVKTMAIDPKASPVRLDVYANDPSPKDEPSGYFGPGQQYRVSVRFTDSQTLNAETFADVRL